MLKDVLLSSRFKSFYWRTTMMVLAVLISQAATAVNLFELPEYAVVVIGLVLGEISKHINNQLSRE